jgi:hypothetical protein
MKRGIALLLLAGLLTACNVSTGEGTRPDLSDNEAFALARKRVAESLKDPDSAKFGPHFYRKIALAGLGKPADVICGTVNGKNSFGAYTGAKTFVYRLADDRVLMDGQDSDPLYKNVGSLWCGNPAF